MRTEYVSENVGLAISIQRSTRIKYSAMQCSAGTQHTTYKMINQR